MRSKEVIKKILADVGIEINGDNPWDVQVYDERVYDRVLSGGSLAAGESYMDCWWDAEDLAEFFNRLLRKYTHKKVFNTRLFFYVLQAKLFNLQSKRHSRNVLPSHYNIGNDLYICMLGKHMAYSCGYWKDAQTLDDAQEAKFELICKKIGLKKGDRVLDVGGGYGGFAKYAAEIYGVHVVLVTNSSEHTKLASERMRGLSVEVRLQDYRDIEDEKFDHIVSICMFEHVGHKNHSTFMRCMQKLLKDDGLFLMQTIVGNKSAYRTDPWIDKYIFPKGVAPSAQQIGHSIEDVFVLEDWHNFSNDYYKTLMSWFQNFDAHWDEIEDKYDERFYRMWKYYLLMIAGSFKARKNQLVQIVFSPNGVKGGYRSVR